jgi:CheY-like chemotaxis protein
LLVEDDEQYIELTREAIKEVGRDGKVKIHFSEFQNGENAISYLRAEAPYSNSVKPDLILLDLNLPGKHGDEILCEIRNDPNLRHIPVIILTNSVSEEDILNAYRLGANCFITKPHGWEQYTHFLKTVEAFWFTIAQLPPR